MPKNIILCSDGTGNSGGKGYGTNVWRLYLALDHHPHNAGTQVAFYDDGVGSQDYKILKAIGGAFGWGISENLRELYAFLMLHYEPGDKIYVFGFSRGAFTIRTLGNMIRYCGVADCDGMSANDIDKRAAAALRAYKHRDPKQPTGGDALQEFKRTFGRFSDPAHTSKDIPIEFIGVWDTVGALGLPIEEMKHGLDHFFQLQFHDGENDLHPGIKNAYHALCIDDERLTFHPVLWDESLKVEGQVVEQVWFAGMHSNVGGGYPKDQLSLVPLIWIMEKAELRGLSFHQSLLDEYQRDHDVDGQMYNSRAGLNVYYRYAPRDIQKIADAAHVKAGEIKIHVSVLERILNATDEYAPAGLPEKYQVEPPAPPAGPAVPGGPPLRPAETNVHDRHKQLKIVRDIVWWRRALQYVFMAWTAALVVWCIRFWTDEVADFGSFDVVNRGLYYLLNPILALAEAVAPAFLAPAINGLRHHPSVFFGFALGLLVISRLNWKFINQTRELSVHAWHMSLAMHKPITAAAVSHRTWWIRIAHWFRHNPASLAVDTMYKNAVRFAAPFITLSALPVGLLALVVLLVMLCSLARNPVATENKNVCALSKHQDEFTFETQNSMQPTPVMLKKDKTYRITVVEFSDWFDNDHKATPDGLIGDPSDVQKWMGWTRRDPKEPWFKLMAAVGDADSANTWAIGNGGELQAYRDGRLYLFVNDTLGMYHNNKGTATIRVECISP
jgi:uncharacterized protein (DUF2235 family)